jgi:two-component system, chemotaxis family, chemotaxis protein CheY
MKTPPCLLIVDDSRTSRLMIRKIVEAARPDWQIIEAASGDEALIITKEQLPDFVSMDVNMPGISGLEAAGHIRLHHPDIRLVLCTANVQESVRTAAERAGVFFVGKPITPASVAQAISYFEEPLGQVT